MDGEGSGMRVLDTPEVKRVLDRQYMQILARQLDEMRPNAQAREWIEVLWEVCEGTAKGADYFACLLDAWKFERQSQVKAPLLRACRKLLSLLSDRRT
ncbi:hypothetical protein AB3R30_18785 [Leptolyngbyaceae cyanobacterium UHCC 1019]